MSSRRIYNVPGFILRFLFRFCSPDRCFCLYNFALFRLDFIHFGWFVASFVCFFGAFSIFGAFRVSFLGKAPIFLGDFLNNFPARRSRNVALISETEIHRGDRCPLCFLSFSASAFSFCFSSFVFVVLENESDLTRLIGHPVSKISRRRFAERRRDIRGTPSHLDALPLLWSVIVTK